MDYFETVYENVETDLGFKKTFQLGSGRDIHKWESLAEMSGDMLGIEQGQVAKVSDNMGRKALVLSTVIGLVVIYQHIAGYSMLGLTCKNKHLKDILCIKYGVREDTLVMMFGRNSGKDNSHRLNDVLVELSKDINKANASQLDLLQ